MWIFINYLLGTIETIVLFVISLMQESSRQERVWLHFSAERLLFLAFLLVVLGILLWLTIRAIPGQKSSRKIPEIILENESALWLVLIVNILTSIFIAWLLIQPEDFFKDYLAIFVNLRPTLLLFMVLNLQSFFFYFVWYCVRFVEKPQGKIPALKQSELTAVLGIFCLGLILKMLFVLPNGYGMLKDVGETKYLYMLQYFSEGIFLRSATEFTTHYPPLYPLSLMAAFYIKNYAFEVIKILNALFASSLVFPIYLISRRFLDQKTSRLVIVITCLLPFQFLLPIRLLSENLYFPLLVWVLYLIFVKPANKRFRFAWDCLTGFSFGLLYLTRYISLALIPFLILIWWLKPFKEETNVFVIKPQKLLHVLIMIFIAVITFLPWVNIGLDNNLSLSQMSGFGIAANTNPAQLTGLNLAKWVAFYGAYFILLAAPVLNLLLVVISAIRWGDYADDKKRWVMLMMILMIAFGIAIVRHSWRADYNLELPKRLMGRYVIYFVPLFILSAFSAPQAFDKSRYSNVIKFLLINEVLPFGLVFLSYQLVIKGSIIPVNPEFIHPLISIDGYYIQLLGNVFFILTAVLYTGTNLLLWYGKKGFVQFMTVGLVIYYLMGEPAYMNLMVSEQTPQQIGKFAFDAMVNTNRSFGQDLSYEVYLPTDLTGDEMDDVAWTIFIRNPDSTWQVGSYADEKITRIEADAGIVILPITEAARHWDDYHHTMEINGVEYALQIIYP